MSTDPVARFQAAGFAGELYDAQCMAEDACSALAEASNQFKAALLSTKASYMDVVERAAQLADCARLAADAIASLAGFAQDTADGFAALACASAEAAAAAQVVLARVRWAPGSSEGGQL